MRFFGSKSEEPAVWSTAILVSNLVILDTSIQSFLFLSFKRKGVAPMLYFESSKQQHKEMTELDP